MKYSEAEERLSLTGDVMQEVHDEVEDSQAKASLREALSHLNDAEQRLHHLGLVHTNTTDPRKDDPDV